MQYLNRVLNRVEEKTTAWVARHGMALLRVSVGIVFLWFGALKFFPGLSPAEDLAERTMSALSFGLVSRSLSLPVLAAWECAIGLGLITGRFMRASLLLMFLQMSGTILPLFLFPHETWVRFPFAATLEGQYIIKNVVLVAAGLVIYPALRQAAPAADRSASTLLTRTYRGAGGAIFTLRRTVTGRTFSGGAGPGVGRGPVGSEGRPGEAAARATPTPDAPGGG
ncbi:MAG: hypothetical protein A2V77_24640 [Anaeromyxobacter sp. RBG_16_69_14]|nr:MAG: hypothetical protein A2V77_24640 [Anaeromyxobacter sp. RBG_16_69_14]